MTRSAPADEPTPEAKPVALPSRTTVERVSWVGDGRVLVFGGQVQAGEPGWGVEVRVFDEARTVRLPRIGDAPLFAVARDGGTVVSAQRVGETRVEFRLMDPKSREDKKTIAVETKGRLLQMRALAYSPDGARLACVGFSAPPAADKKNGLSGNLLVVDVKTGTLHADLREPDESPMTAVAFSPDGKFLVTGHSVIDEAKPGVKVWDVEKAALLKEWPAKRQYVMDIAVSPDGRRVASVGYSSKRPADGADFKGWEWDLVVSVHDVRTGELVRNLKGHDQSPCCVAFSPDGKLVASGGADKSVRVWSVDSGERVHTFTGHKGQVRGLAFAPDGKRLATGGLDKTVHIWDVTAVKKSEK